MKINKVGIVGYGSIGNKHYEIIKRLNKKIDIYFIRLQNKKKNKLKNVKQVFSIDSALKLKLDCVFICSPSNLHLLHAIQFVKNKTPTFIEKPLVSNLNKSNKKNIDVLLRTAKKLKVPVLVGYVLKHSPIYKKLEKIIKQNSFGKITNVKVICNSNLKKWRNLHYRKTVSSSKILGGGVINELSHEIDYINSLFGKISSIYSNISKIKVLKIKAEESVDIIMVNKKNMPISIHLDFNSFFSYRICEIFYENAKIIWDIKKENFKIIQKKSIEKIYTLKKINNNYSNQLKYFFNLINNKKIDNTSLPSSIEVVKLINLINKSNTKRIEMKNL